MIAYPYVYKGVHKVTGEFYIGYREVNNYAVELDFGVKYFTSSSKVKELGFDNFDWQIIAEFINPDRKIAGDDAYDFEQELIADDFNNPLCLNESCHFKSNIRFKRAGCKLSDEHKMKISSSGKGQKRTDTTKRNISNSLIGKNKTEDHKRNLRKPRTEQAKMNISLSKIGNRASEETKLKMSKAHKGKVVSVTTRDKLSVINKKNYKLMSPDGIEYIGLGLQDFCKRQGLSEYCMRMVCQGKQEHHKGWTGTYVNPD